MKNIFIKFSLIFTLLIMVESCSNEALADLNVDPNAVNEIDMQYLLTLATLRVGAEYENTRVNMLYAAPMIQHTASAAGYFSGDKYFFNAGYSGAYMERQFTDVIKLLSEVISKTKGDASKSNIFAVATLVRAFNMHRMTDIHGDIPYTQAGYGLESQENWFPKYENQKDVYAALVRDVKDAREKLSATGTNLGNQDVVYGGDITKWKKFANALLIRISMRMQKKDEAGGRAIFAEAFASGTFTSNADNAYIKYLAGPQGVNRNGLSDGYWNTYKYSRDCKLSKTFVDWMRANNDPRLMIVSGGVGNPDDNKTWNIDPAAQKGMPNGFTSSNIKTVLTAAEGIAFDANGNRIFSMINLKYLDWEDPYILITHAETQLLIAEAAVRGWVTSTAETHFNAGVTAAINAWTAFDPTFARSAADVTKYITDRRFAAADNTGKLRLIGEEYWAASWLDDIESWSNWRRSGIPALTPTRDPNSEEGATIPRRLRYWQNEAGSNPANFKAAVDRMGGDLFLTKIWWDGGN